MTAELSGNHKGRGWMLDSLAAGIMDQFFMVNLVNPTRNDGEIG